MTGPKSVLTTRDLTKRYRTGAGDVSVLDRISLEVNQGDSVAIVGPSGSGKSTLLQIVGTLDIATEGVVELNGRDFSTLSEEEVSQLRNAEIGFVFQSHYLLPQCTAWENVLIPTLASQKRVAPAASGPVEQTSTSPARSEPVEQRAERLLKRVGLGERMHHFPGQLSGGECQRVAVVRALINQPKLLLADEPTGALDQASAESLANLLVELNKEEQVTLIVVTHSLDLAHRMKRVMRLEGGSLREGALS